MFHGKLHLMEFPKFFHTFSDISFRKRIADPCPLQKAGNLTSVFRIDVRYVVTDFLSGNYMVHCRFLPAVNEFVRPLTRNAHNILLSVTMKRKGAVCHSFFQDCQVRNFICPFVHQPAGQPDDILFCPAGPWQSAGTCPGYLCLICSSGHCNHFPFPYNSHFSAFDSPLYFPAPPDRPNSPVHTDTVVLNSCSGQKWWVVLTSVSGDMVILSL